jgi:hypothetical protein
VTAEALVELLTGQLEENGYVPDATPAWDRAASELLAAHPSDEIEGVIRFSQDNSFWRTRIKSLPLLRAHFNDLRLEAESKGWLGSQPTSGTRGPLSEEDIQRRLARYRTNIAGAELYGEPFLSPAEVEENVASEEQRLRGLRRR